MLSFLVFFFFLLLLLLLLLYFRLDDAQVTEFREGKAIDDVMPRIWLEGLGQGNRKESYDLAAYYYASNLVQFAPGHQKPFMFITGDEGLYDKVNPEWVKTYIGAAIDDPPKAAPAAAPAPLPAAAPAAPSQVLATARARAHTHTLSLSLSTSLPPSLRPTLE